MGNNVKTKPLEMQRDLFRNFAETEGKFNRKKHDRDVNECDCACSKSDIKDKEGVAYMTQLTSDSEPSHFTREKRVVACRPAGASRRSFSPSTIGILTSNIAFPVTSSTPSMSLMKAQGRALRGQMRTGHKRDASSGQEGNEPAMRTTVWLRGLGGGGGGG